MIFPIFFNINCYASLKERKIFFCLTLFNFLKIAGGYIEYLYDGIFIHYTNTKAYLITNKKIFGLQKKFKPLKDYTIIRWNMAIDYGCGHNIMQCCTISFLLCYVIEQIKWFLYNSKPYLETNNKINVYKEEKFLKIYLNFTFIFNVLMVIISVIKILMEKILYALSKRCQQN